MTQSYPHFKAAACHAASVFLDSAKTTAKACDLIAEAARNGAALVVFPESFIPGFPVWAGLQAPIQSHGFFAALAAEALRLDGLVAGHRVHHQRKEGYHRCDDDLALEAEAEPDDEKRRDRDLGQSLKTYDIGIGHLLEEPPMGDCEPNRHAAGTSKTESQRRFHNCDASVEPEPAGIEWPVREPIDERAADRGR